MRHAAFILVLLSFDVAHAVDQKGGTVLIKNIGILGPVTGSQETAGRVDIEVTGPKIASPVIELRSSNQGIASVPMTVTPSQGSAIFVVKTSPVTKPTDVTITAQVGTSSKSATLQILPPKFNVLGCDLPANVIPQKPLKCTAWLDGLAAEAITVNLSTSLPTAATVPPNVTIPRGANKQTFQVRAEPIAQAATVRVSGTYAGVTQSVPITVLPVALESLTVSPASIVGGNQFQLGVKLTAPPPQSGLVVKFSTQVSNQDLIGLSVPSSVTFKNEADSIPLTPSGVNSPTTVTITASSNLLTAGDSRVVTLKVLPATLQSISIEPNHFSNVPLGGQEAKVSLWLDGWLCCGLGAPYESAEIQYSGDTQVIGPAHVRFKYFNATDFTVKVSPCSVQQTCTVFIKAKIHGEKQTSATVTK
jgi:hypothetical protein